MVIRDQGSLWEHAFQMDVDYEAQTQSILEDPALNILIVKWVHSEDAKFFFLLHLNIRDSLLRHGYLE